ncbi:RloB family protein [Holdemania massiliensis]|uniref:RloB family protein n=1 Tax=Holdemania massiliensis TaxID=1468449 RepID=UPI001F065A10|nr:RloB family protein [Holdemania massiliensis]MCH1940085.1 RloB family protein [Holdemania massiliensis]
MRKENRTYYFSVEGETEKWYFDWLQETINKDPHTRYTVKLNSKKIDPIAFVKRMTILERTTTTHIFDRESEEARHVQHFKYILDQMQKAQNSGKILNIY